MGPSTVRSLANVVMARASRAQHPSGIRTSTLAMSALAASRELGDSSVTRETPFQISENQPFYPCGSPKHEDDFGHLPPPLPEPTYSVNKRILPSSLTALSSDEGREYLLQALTNKTAESYWRLMEQFVTQSDPAFCGITTLVMVLNAMGVDPNVRWKGGWRFYGSEDVILNNCCLSAERIRRAGVTLEEFRLLSKCQGLSVDMKRPINPDHNHTSEDIVHHPHRPSECQSLEAFRHDVQRTLTTPNSASVLVSSFSREALGQTGDGHFSPIAAFHPETDQVLVLDVARFKYAPFWVKIEALYYAMQPKDSATKRSRGWFLLHPPTGQNAPKEQKEIRRPAEIVPVLGDPNVCPVGRVKVGYCPANSSRDPAQ
jgi:Phytochelatin synthase